MREQIREILPRNAFAAPCNCGGYADEADNGPTEEEIQAYDCSRKRACCIRAFKCRICGSEFIAPLDAPDIG